MLTLKRVYDHEAPPERWGTITSQCPTCMGRGVVINEQGTGVEACSGCPLLEQKTYASGSTAPLAAPRGTGEIVRRVPPVKDVEVVSAKDRHHFSTRLIEGGIAEGWLSMGQGKITVGNGPASVVYTIVSGPGLYCCHCNTKQDDSVMAQGHVARVHARVPSPDKNNPSGYRRDNFYTSTLVRAEG